MLCVFMILSEYRKRCRKGQESMLNIMAVVMLVSVVFLYFFFVTQNQKIESSNMIAKQQKYKYAEIVLMNMYYVQPDGAHSTVAEIIGESQRFSDEDHDWVYFVQDSRVDAQAIVWQYLSQTLTDYNYYFFVERDSGRSFEINAEPPQDVDIMVHRCLVPMPDPVESAVAYLYIW